MDLSFILNKPIVKKSKKKYVKYVKLYKYP